VQVLVELANPFYHEFGLRSLHFGVGQEVGYVGRSDYQLVKSGFSIGELPAEVPERFEEIFEEGHLLPKPFEPLQKGLVEAIVGDDRLREQLVVELC